jgi:hypothetical protein
MLVQPNQPTMKSRIVRKPANEDNMEDSMLVPINNPGRQKTLFPPEQPSPKMSLGENQNIYQIYVPPQPP